MNANRSLYKTFVFSLLILSIISGCTPYKYSEEIDRARKSWQAQKIEHYQIHIEFYESFGQGLSTERDVVVNDGKLVKTQCSSSGCPAFALSNIFTVDDLFKAAEGGTTVGGGGSINECMQNISFDIKYGFPNSISVDCPNVIDDEHSLQVTSFEVLK